MMDFDDENHFIKVHHLIIGISIRTIEHFLLSKMRDSPSLFLFCGGRRYQTLCLRFALTERLSGTITSA
jgi:hypothetical protein